MCGTPEQHKESKILAVAKKLEYPVENSCRQIGSKIALVILVFTEVP